MIKDLITKNRSYRRFSEKEVIREETLLQLVDLARLSPSAANRQPLKYIISSNSKRNSKIFKFLKWAAYLKDWNGPKEGERPTGYIICLGDKSIGGKFDYDLGLASLSILLGATEMGLGGCIIHSIEREKLRSELNIDDNFEILSVIALGKPIETVVIESVGVDGDIKYWRDDQEVHHVPKRSLEDIVITI